VNVLRTLLLSVFSIAAFLHAGETERPALTLLYTAEAHGALLPCDCPLQPLGGVARRMTAIKKYRAAGPTLLIDGGGWSAGGLYDEDSDGTPERDTLRTSLMQQAMSKMSYTAITPSDADKPRELRPATPAPGFPQIFISRLGEDETTRFAETLERDALVFNAGRKSSQRISWRANKATCVNFDFQAQRLVVVELFARGAGEGFEIRARQEALTKDIPDDPEIAAILAPYEKALAKKGKRQVEIEFWTMPECPGCNELRPTIQSIAEELRGRVNVRLHFVTGSRDGQLTSLHGENELLEARVQAAVQQYFPEKIWQWLTWRHANEAARWEEGARALKILPARIRGALSTGEADAMLVADQKLALTRRISGTPTLIIANRMYDQPNDRAQILRALCGILQEPKPATCASVPACFFDAQCRKRGTIGRCVEAGTATARCDNSQAAVKVPATVILDKDALFENSERILEAMIGDLPGLDYRVVDVNSDEGRALAVKHRLTHLPAYILDPVARTERGYAESIAKVVREDKANGALVAHAGAVGAMQILARERVKGRLDLFAARMSKNGQESVEAAIEHFRSSAGSKPELVLHDALYWKESDGHRELAASGGLAEIQEAAIAAAVKSLAPEKFHEYLLERGRARGSMYWDVAVKKVGLDPERVRKLAEAPDPEILKTMKAEADLLKSLDAGGDITALAENCELVTVRSRQDLRDLMDRIGARSAPQKQK